MAALDVAISAMEHFPGDLAIIKYGLLMIESLAVSDDNCVGLMRTLPLVEAALDRFDGEELDDIVGIIVGILKNLSTVDANQVGGSGVVVTMNRNSVRVEYVAHCVTEGGPWVGNVLLYYCFCVGGSLVHQHHRCSWLM